MPIVVAACLLVAATITTVGALSRRMLDSCLPRASGRDLGNGEIGPTPGQDVAEAHVQHPSSPSANSSSRSISTTDNPRKSGIVIVNHYDEDDDDDDHEDATSTTFDGDGAEGAQPAVRSAVDSPREHGAPPADMAAAPTTSPSACDLEAASTADSNPLLSAARHSPAISPRGRSRSRARDPSPSSPVRGGRPSSPRRSSSPLRSSLAPASRLSPSRRSEKSARASAATLKAASTTTTTTTAEAAAAADAGTPARVAEAATATATASATATLKAAPAAAGTPTTTSTATTTSASSLATSASPQCSMVNLESGDFAAMVRMVKPAQLRDFFIHNVKSRATEVGMLAEVCALTRMAQVGLGGNRFGKGTLTEGPVLGEGSFGIVKEACHSLIPGDFAIKMLKKGASEAARVSIMVEMIAMARLARVPHPNLIAAVAMDDGEGATDSMPIMLLKAETDLGTVFRSGVTSVSQRLRWVQQAVSGLRHMHAQGIGHGDIKLENILIFDDGDGEYRAVVADFGMARAMGEPRPKLMGSPGSMPAEVMQGSVITHESQDVFGVAAVAFMLCVPEDKAQANMFVSQELYTPSEQMKKEVLRTLARDGCPPATVQKQTQMFEMNMTIRTMSDGSFADLLAVDNLHPGLGSTQDKEMVRWCLPPYMDLHPHNRPDMESFGKVVGNLAKAAEEWEAQV